jgi:flagellar protein FlaJ
MSTENNSPGLGNLAASEALETLAEAYEQMEMPVRRYAITVVAPGAFVFLLSLVAAVVLPLPVVVRLPMPLLGITVALAALGYPKLLVEQRRHEMENKLHLVITHMTVLSTTNIDRMEVFRTLAREEEYGEFAKEFRRIVQLVDTWNQSLDDACRQRAKQVPSDSVSDFLDRLAYTLGAGQSLTEFLLGEQEVIIQNYVTAYESALGNLDVMKDLYLSMVLSMTFALVFAVVLPMLAGVNPTMTVAAVIVLYIFVQVGFAYAVKTVTPTDPLWYHPEGVSTDSERRIRWSLVAGVALTVFLGVYVALDIIGASPVPLASLTPWEQIGMPIYAAIPLTPLLIPGAVLRAEENLVKARDEDFPSFIRALGASESAKQSTSSDVLAGLRKKDFGALTANIDDLYKRLNIRIESADAWRYFTAECRSYLIQKFSEMYLIGRQMGGTPKQLGELISENMNEALQLRERRKQATVTLIGLLYGITAASTFAFFIGLQVVTILSNLSFDLNTAELGVGRLIYTNVYDIPTIEFLLVLVILFNALLSSLMIRGVDGGHKMNSYVHFVTMTWLGAVIAVVTKWMTSMLLGV